MDGKISSPSPIKTVTARDPLVGRLSPDLPKELSYKGEFGTELISFIPYVHWLFRTGHLQGRRVSIYKGMKPFYFFLPDEQIVERDEPRHFVGPRARPKHWPQRDCMSAVEDGLCWFPDYRLQFQGRTEFEKPILVVQNKYTNEWTSGPVNYLDNSILDTIAINLSFKYQIIYFRGKIGTSARSMGFSADHQLSPDDSDLDEDKFLARNPQIIDFNQLCEESGETYNQMKLRIFADSRLFITTQGGNAYLCSLFGGSAAGFLHRKGAETSHAYPYGFFQFASRPSNHYFIATNNIEMHAVINSFADLSCINDRIVLGDISRSVYQILNEGRFRIPEKNDKYIAWRKSKL